MKNTIKEAFKAMKNAYAPYSNYHVGACVLCKDGRTFYGANIENASYPAGICAERTAMSKAISEGDREFDRIVIATATGSGWPCGICRQFMYEFAPELKVVAGEDEDSLEAYSLSDLLVKGFRLEE